MNWLLYASPIFLGKISGQLTTHKNGKGLDERDIGNFLRSECAALAGVVPAIPCIAYVGSTLFIRRRVMFAGARRVVRTRLVRCTLCPVRDADHTFVDQLRQPSTQCRCRNRAVGQDVLLLHGLMRRQKVEDHLSIRRPFHGRISSMCSMCARTQSSMVVLQSLRRRAQRKCCSTVLCDRCD